MEVLGEVFPPGITNQVMVRQEIYGKAIRSIEDTAYLNANSSWLKLSSGVDIANINAINNSNIARLGLTGKDLAKSYVLFGGVSSGSAALSGVAFSHSNKAYGIGGTDFGVRPMMGLQSANIKYENRGSLRRASVRMKAYNRLQFEIIDILYLRLGFSVLLEWGHTLYKDNSGNYKKTTEDLSEIFINGQTTSGTNLSYYDILDLIQKQRLKTDGNYDAMMAKVSNFHWSFMPDGSYDITLDLVSIGDVVDSFKLNSGNNFSNTQFSASISSSLDQLSTFSLINVLQSSNVIAANFNTSNTHEQVFSSGFPETSQYYITLRELLNTIKIFGMYNVTNNAGVVKMLEIKDDFYSVMSYDDFQVSLDPGICLLPVSFTILGSTYNSYPSVWTPPTSEDDFNFNIVNLALPGRSSPSSYPYANILGILINLRYAVLKFEELKDPDTGNVTLIDYLNSMLSDVNRVTGGVSSLEAFIDESTNTLQIIDKNPLPNLPNLIAGIKASQVSSGLPASAQIMTGNPALFMLYGFKRGAESGFIKDFSFKTELSNNFSTMITVSAAANSTVVGENDTALSKLNKGLKDTYKTEMTTPFFSGSFSPPTGTTKQDAIVAVLNRFGAKYIDLCQYIIYLSNGSYEPGLAASLSSTLRDMILYRQKVEQDFITGLSTLNSPNSTGFIPFNLSLTMDGLSGMAINNRFDINVDFLPSNYPNNVQFLIRNIEHTIENNKWNTLVESYMISKSS